MTVASYSEFCHIHYTLLCSELQYLSDNCKISDTCDASDASDASDTCDANDTNVSMVQMNVIVSHQETDPEVSFFASLRISMPGEGDSSLRSE
jgi:hypothetical protein